MTHLGESTISIGDAFTPIELRKYISYAKTFVHPTLSNEAKLVFKNFYKELRSSKSDISITPRCLESMMRLGEARARCELREIVSENDAKDVVCLLSQSICNLNGVNRDFNQPQKKQRNSKANKLRMFLKTIQDVSQSSGKVLYSVFDLKDIADRLEMNIPNFDRFVDKLNVQGFLLRQSNGNYKVVSGII